MGTIISLIEPTYLLVVFWKNIISQIIHTYITLIILWPQIPRNLRM